MTDHDRIDDLRRRVQQEPASIAFAQLAEEYRRTGQNREAVDTCRAGLALHPEYLSARVTLGRALLAMDLPADAVSELTMVLSSAPENLAALRALAEAHRRMDNLTEALGLFTRASRLAPNDPEIERGLADVRTALDDERRDPAAARRGRARRTVVTLERWLEAIHAARADRRP